MMAVFTAPDRISTPTITTKMWNSQPQQLRPGQLHRQAAQQVVGILVADVRGADDHAGEHA